MAALLGASACAAAGSSMPKPTPAQIEIIWGAVLARVSPGLVGDVPICLSLADGERRGDPDTTAVWLRGLGRRVTTPSQCPRTYTSMMLVVDTLGRPVDPPRPPGYLDPYYINLWRPVRIDARILLVRYEQRQGTRGKRVYCEVVEARPGPHVNCVTIGSWIS
jgi:hypothetical protein